MGTMFRFRKKIPSGVWFSLGLVSVFRDVHLAIRLDPLCSDKDNSNNTDKIITFPVKRGGGILSNIDEFLVANRNGKVFALLRGNALKETLK